MTPDDLADWFNRLADNDEVVEDIAMTLRARPPEALAGTQWFDLEEIVRRVLRGAAHHYGGKTSRAAP